MSVLLFLVVAYPLGVVFIGGFYLLWRRLGFLKVYGEERLPRWPTRMIYVGNHPSKTLQPVLLVGMFFRCFLVNPLRYSPYSVADRDNFYNSLWFRPFRRQIIPIDRRKKPGETDLEGIAVMNRVASSGGNIIIYPEGGRTWKHDARFVYVSPGGNVIRPLKAGFAEIARRYDYTVVPYWTEVRGFRVRVYFGDAITGVAQMDRKEIIARTMDRILSIADVVFPSI